MKTNGFVRVLIEGLFDGIKHSTIAHVNSIKKGFARAIKFLNGE